MTILPHGRTTSLSLHPALVASRFNESSPSPWARTWPLSANEVQVESARPFASTSAITICTDAWSFEVMRRSWIQDGALSAAASCLYSPGTWGTTHWSQRTCVGRKGQQEGPWITHVNQHVSVVTTILLRRTWSFSMMCVRVVSARCKTS
jgi:hypothetical protein